MPSAIQNLVVLGDCLDGENWADFLVEWIGGEPQRSRTDGSPVLGTHTANLAPVRYANYAVGGAFALCCLKDQVAEYIAARRALTAKTKARTAQHRFTGQTLHIIWIGLDDLITGTGVGPLIEDIYRLVNSIPNSVPTNPGNEHFILIDLPSPMVSVPVPVKKVSEFNDALGHLATHWPPPGPGPGDGPGATPANISLVRMSDWMQVVSDNAKTFELIARQITDVLVAKYTLGTLNRQSWPEIRPFPTIPGI
ncbi:MAG: hypothetical protein JWN03_1933 [Nocardia sp.]|uniref:hypothetical protein n=1 Tax=Nocardia sp. TaxID=1821 RepID=UPI002634105A|nr:hypothetical protein [Nocardia sp.]MCU1641658.1 hypothetical protein [Nocardia sp.]